MSDTVSVEGPGFDLESHRAWIAERTKAAESMGKSTFVTISREFGCDGFPTAIALQKLLAERTKSSWHIFTHTIMDRLIADEGLGADLITEVSDKRYSFVDWFIDGIVPSYLKSAQSQAFERMRTLILNLAGKGNCIIVGGGAQIITRALDPEKFCGTHVRIVGSRPFRMRSIVRKHKLSRGETEVFLDKKESARNRFVQDFTDQSTDDLSLYHLVFNNELNSPDLMAKTVFSYMDLQKVF